MFILAQLYLFQLYNFILHNHVQKKLPFTKH